MEENPDDKWFFSFSEEKEKWVLIKKLSTGIAYVNESGADFAVKDSKALVIVDAYNALTTTPIRELNDLASCQDLSDQAIVYSLERRLEGKLIYTYVGDIIIAMNPFVRLPILHRRRGAVVCWQGSQFLRRWTGSSRSPCFLYHR